MEEPGEQSSQAADLAEKEAWAQSVAEVIHLNSNFDKVPISYEDALVGARWASLWVDDFKDLMEKENPNTQAELKAVMKRAKDSALERSEAVQRYPTGALALRFIRSAYDGFIMAFDPEERAKVSELLEWRQ